MESDRVTLKSSLFFVNHVCVDVLIIIIVNSSCSEMGQQKQHKLNSKTVITLNNAVIFRPKNKKLFTPEYYFKYKTIIPT